jgi:hypothetical protein
MNDLGFFIQVVEIVKPPILVTENVPEFFSFETVYEVQKIGGELWLYDHIGHSQG